MDNAASVTGGADVLDEGAVELPGTAELLPGDDDPEAGALLVAAELVAAELLDVDVVLGVTDEPALHAAAPNTASPASAASRVRDRRDDARYDIGYLLAAATLPRVGGASLIEICEIIAPGARRGPAAARGNSHITQPTTR
jgi:hypothetical protein